MRITINLSPADLRKEGTAFDLPIAVALLGALEWLTWAGSPQWNGVPTRKGSPPGNMNLDAHQRGSLGVLLSELRTHLSLLSTSACTEVVRRRAPRPGGPWHRREGPVCEPSRSDGRRPPRDVTLPAGRVPRGPAQRRNEAAAG